MAESVIISWFRVLEYLHENAGTERVGAGVTQTWTAVAVTLLRGGRRFLR